MKTNSLMIVAISIFKIIYKKCNKVIKSSMQNTPARVKAIGDYTNLRSKNF